MDESECKGGRTVAAPNASNEGVNAPYVYDCGLRARPRRAADVAKKCAFCVGGVRAFYVSALRPLQCTCAKKKRL
jgi:hypothetical protein